ncbi:MAG TPA: hypothetical protein VF296_05235 [Gallionella sp.]
MHFTDIGRVGAGLLLVALLTGCAGIPPEQLARLSTVEVADGNTMHSVDSKVTLFTDSVNVEPGTHIFEMTTSCYNNSCIQQAYRFKAEAGYLYRLMPDRTILVLDRNDRYQRKLGELTLYGASGIDYGTSKQIQAFNQDVAKQQAAAQATLIERRRQYLPLMRKQGAKLCQVQGQIRYIGFVESVTDEKVQIRVVEGAFNDNNGYVLANFKPQIVWDSPLNWDLCE